MRCKIGVVSIGKMNKSLVREVNYMKLNADFVFTEQVIHEDMELPSELSEADVLISSGFSAKNLRAITGKPIIVIEPSLYDILAAFSIAVEYDPNPVIIFPLKEYTEKIRQISKIISVPMVTATYDDTAQLDSIIAKYASLGCNCFIGSGLVCDEAERMGYHSVFVYPRESLQTYIKLAYDSATALREKVRENKLMSLIIDNSKDGLIFTDESGCILLCSPAAHSLFPAELVNPVGSNILDHVKNRSLDQLYSEQIPVNNVIVEHNDEQFLLSAFPIYFNKDVTNVVLTIYSVNSIQSKERHIRRELSNKGFSTKYRFSELFSRNAEYNIMLESAKKFAKHNDNVLILGRTGCGKEVLAQSIHNGSTRSDYPFVAVNCSAIAETLLESELFGYDEGAFTGAKKGGKPGFFELAHGGTIFLDEISELSLRLQSKLLRAIQEKQVIHVGGSKVISFDVRIIAASNRDLWKMVQDNLFREDLYYRLAVLELNIPALCERKEDIMPLFIEFLEKRNPELAHKIEEQCPQMERILCSYSWSGNIRELENFAHMASVTVGQANTPQEIIRILGKEINRRCERMGIVPVSDDLFSSAQSLEDRIRSALRKTGGNHTKAAELLGMSRSTLWRNIKILGINEQI